MLQLGITPTDSVVVVGFDEAHTIVVTLRLDPPGSDQKSAVAALFAQGRLSRLAHATLIVTGPDEQVLTGALVVRDALEVNGIAVGHVHSVDYRERTWQTERCDCGQCPQGAERLPEAHGIGAVLDAAVRGIDPSLTRAQLEQGCRPTPAEEEIALLAEREEVVSLIDLLLRRTSIAFVGGVTGDTLVEVANAAAPALGWDADETDAQVAAATETLRDAHRIDVSTASLAPQHA